MYARDTGVYVWIHKRHLYYTIAQHVPAWLYLLGHMPFFGTMVTNIAPYQYPPKSKTILPLLSFLDTGVKKVSSLHLVDTLNIKECKIHQRSTENGNTAGSCSSDYTDVWSSRSA